MSTLTVEQKQKIEENRLRALQKRAGKINTYQGTTIIPSKFPDAENKTSPLTAEQKQKIEENRLKALQRRAEKNNVQHGVSSPNKVAVTKVTIPANKITVPVINKSAPADSPRGVLNTSVERPGLVARPGGAAKPSRTNGTHARPPAHSGASFYGRPAATAVTGACQLISPDRFVVDTVGFSQPLIECFKQQPERTYHPEERRWSFPVSGHERLSSALQQLRPAVAVAPLPSHVLRILSQPAPAGDADLSTLDPVLLEALMPFQREGILRGVACGGRMLIADDMGLGKTIQAIGIMAYFHDWPLLVVCPSSMRYQWRQEFLRFLPSQHPKTMAVMDTSKDLVADARVLIASYDLVTRCGEKLRAIHFPSVIMDESHYLKSYKAARTRAAVPLMKVARRCLLLSGTPALSRPIELFTQVAAVDRKFGLSYQQFGQRYCNGQHTAWGWDFSGASNMAELQILLERRVMLRRLKRDVIVQLPAKRRQLVLLDPSQVDAGSDTMTQWEQRLARRGLRGMERRGELLQYFRQTASAKLPAVLSYLETLLDAGQRLLCFAHHQLVLDGVCRLLERRGEGYVRIDGSTTPENRQRQCQRFQLGGHKARVAVLSITAANAGITLTSASRVVFAELFWNPGILTQAEDRAHRIGQTDSVQVTYLVARGTADDHIWPLVQRKLDVLNRAGLSKDDFTEAAEGRQRRADQPDIAQFFSEFENLPPEALVALEDEEMGESSPKRLRNA